MLAAKRYLPSDRIQLRPVVHDRSESTEPLYHWYDQILSDVKPGALFHIAHSDIKAQSSPVWSDAITFWGDGRVALRRVPSDVLETVLEDIRPGLARILLTAQPSDPSVDFTQTALIGINAESRREVANRLTFDAHTTPTHNE